MKDQILYYQKRAKEYDLVYQKPERQSDLDLIKKYLTRQFKNKSILEIACGTGYWTEILAKNTNTITAIDINEEVLSLARKKGLENQGVKFKQLDIANLAKRKDDYEGLFGGFIWSHILKEETMGFLEMSVNQVKPGSEIIFLDNHFVQGSSTPISRKDKNGNSYQKRYLQSGEAFEVLKNFPDREEIENLVYKIGTHFEWIDYEYYWLMKFRKR